MTPIDTSNANPQKESPLFDRILGEIRNHIFDLALTAYHGKQEPFEKNAFSCRPGFCYADVRIHTALLRTCRRVYQEARLVPSQNFVYVKWCTDPDTEPSAVARMRYSRLDVIYSRVTRATSLHVFFLQWYLERTILKQYQEEPLVQAFRRVRNLKITIRHCDWLAWQNHDVYRLPLALDAKQKGDAYASSTSKAADDFHELSWGREFLLFEELKILELELETVEERRKELDDIVNWAETWRFPHKDGNALVLVRTKKTGWHRARNSNECESTDDPIKAKERLVNDGINFIAWDGEPEVLNHQCLTYYVVSLTYEVQKASTPG